MKIKMIYQTALKAFLPFIMIFECFASPIILDKLERPQQISVLRKFVLDQLELKEEPKAQAISLHTAIIKRMDIKLEKREESGNNYKAQIYLKGRESAINTYEFDFSSASMDHPSEIHSIELDVIHNSKAFSFGELEVKDVSSKELMHRIRVGSDGTWSTPDITHKILSWAAKSRNTDIFKVNFDCAAIKTRCLQKQHPPGIRINYKTKSRVKRRNSKCSGDGRCCLRNITATAEEMGWSNWMISPKDLNLFFCAGTCNSDSKLSFHGKLAELTSGKKPELCCIPTQIEYVHYFHVKDNFTAFHKPIKMNVTECGCG